MRRNKTYNQQLKYYAENGEQTTLTEVFVYWLEYGNMSAKRMQEVYRECSRECKKKLIEEMYWLVDRKDLHELVTIFMFGE